MHPQLIESLRKLDAHFRGDARCPSMYLTGSLGKGTADAYSDVDVALIVHDEHYAAVKGELRAVCEALCGPIVVWLPEGETSDACNYAFLFEAESDLLLYDFHILKASLVSGGHARPGRILFDPNGLLQAEGEAAPLKPVASGRLAWTVDNYWVYMYLNGKYFLRADLFKLLYVQSVLFHTHLQLLQFLHPEAAGNWWARDVASLPDERRADLLVYFGATDLPGISAALRREIDLFGRDARAACEKAQIAYPAAVEDAVRRHLQATGAIEKDEGGRYERE